MTATNDNTESGKPLAAMRGAIYGAVFGLIGWGALFAFAYVILAAISGEKP